MLVETVFWAFPTGAASRGAGRAMTNWLHARAMITATERRCILCGRPALEMRRLVWKGVGKRPALTGEPRNVGEPFLYEMSSARDTQSLCNR